MLQRFTTFIVLFFTNLTMFAQSATSGEILLIGSYSADSYYMNEFAELFISEYTQIGGRHTVSIEVMNCNTLDSNGSWFDAMTDITNRHPNPSLVMLYGPEAMGSFFSLTDDKWKQVPVCITASPIVLAGIDSPSAPSAMQKNNNEDRINFREVMKGFNVKMCYYYEYGFNDIAQMAKRFDPNIRTIAIVSDNSYSGYSMLCNAQKAFRDSNLGYEIISIDGRKDDTQTACEKIRNLPHNSAILYCIWRYDKNGSIALNQTEKLLSQINDKPVFTVTGRGFGDFVFGGATPIYNWSDGRIHPSNFTYELIDRNSDLSPYFYKCPNEHKFDIQKFEHLGYDSSLIPEGAILLNTKMTLTDIYQMYPTQFILSIALFIVLSIALILASSYLMRINKLKSTLIRSERQLRIEKLKLEDNEIALRAAKEKAEASDKMKSLFINNMSHEIRTPLNAIQGFSHVILDPMMQLDNQTRANLMQRISLNISCITDIVDDILEYSDLESGLETINNTLIDLNVLCSDLIRAMELYKKPQVKITLAFDSEQAKTLRSDEKLIKVVLTHLLKNACKFTNDGSIEIFCSTENGHTLFTVTDTGPGIPKDKAEFIFERFKKISEFSQGIGLGLSICKLIANRLSGDIWLDTSYSTGSRFVFKIAQNDKP